MSVDLISSHWPFGLKKISLNDFSFLRIYQKSDYLYPVLAGCLDNITVLELPKFYIINRQTQAEPPETEEDRAERLIKAELRLITTISYEKLQSMVEKNQFYSTRNCSIAKIRLDILYKISLRRSNEDSSD